MTNENALQRFLLDGFTFDVDRSLTKPFSRKKTRSFRIKPFKFAVLANLSKLYGNLEIDENAIADEPTREAKILTGKYAYSCARIIATAVAGNSLFRFATIPILSFYFFQKIDPAAMVKLQSLIHHLANYPDMLDSLRYLSSARTTKPRPSTENEEGDYDGPQVESEED